jgi:hypothetical protein
MAAAPSATRWSGRRTSCLDREAEEAEEEERWWRMGMVCDALFERWGEDD